jgi:hypothetical protein
MKVVGVGCGVDLVFKVLAVADTVKPASMQAVTVAVTATVLVMAKKASDAGRTIFN